MRGPWGHPPGEGVPTPPLLKKSQGVLTFQGLHHRTGHDGVPGASPLPSSPGLSAAPEGEAAGAGLLSPPARPRDADGGGGVSGAPNEPPNFKKKTVGKRRKVSKSKLSQQANLPIEGCPPQVFRQEFKHQPPPPMLCQHLRPRMRRKMEGI